MARTELQLQAPLTRLDALLASIGGRVLRPPVERISADAAALRFHLRPRTGEPVLAVILGGTGTGKSTILNRLIGQNVSATSFRRTFTAGAVAVVAPGQAVPANWLGVEHIPAESLPARGRAEALILATVEGALAPGVIPVDTPDLDGDQPRHHAQADRAFRWADAIVFIVTPEKYQMTELLPYYRLAGRYGVPALFVMNKCEESVVADDFARQLADRGHPSARLFIVPRDDAGYEPPPDAGLDALRQALASLSLAPPESRREGLAMRALDLAGRIQDQLVAPLRDQRREADRLVQSMASLVTPEPGVDVSDVTQQLQRRMQQRSVLYLMGPQRVLDRVRQVPGLLARLPRAAWDVVIGGEKPSLGEGQLIGAERDVPDFRDTLADQLSIVHSRINDALRSSDLGRQWLDHAADTYAAALIPTEQAARIVDEELDDLKKWLTDRWNATPRDTAILQKLLKHLPGGRKLTEWSEAAPYLLAIVVATHHAFFGHIDLLILGGWSLATWISERLSNEVAARTRLANRRIAERFAHLAARQVDQVRAWIAQQVPGAAVIAQLHAVAVDLQMAARPVTEGTHA